MRKGEGNIISTGIEDISPMKRDVYYAVFINKTFRNYTRTMVSFTVTDHQSNIGPTKLN